ncbi:polysaccharide pyruvyl transferase family protein [Adlercreutzia sp. ZJ154]|uniref:polysaccharide pyruvyl transferase family protein n=1 Tax=Adlercreutzia sp. ZJ154 TaxID=2709790 RepID=UPI0013ED9B1A|nr:polysaccharide pyruvyl transferase family protein [Adlercreutzia sp. ZJ154]
MTYLFRGNIAIVTLQGGMNYGNRLQNYAIAKIYERLGYRTESLLRGDSINLTSIVFDRIRRIIKVKNASNGFCSSWDRKASFERFARHLTFRKTNEDDKKLSSEYDYFSVGSDQVWNLGRLSDRDSWFYLRFAHFNQRIALAPSIGVSNLSYWQMKRLKKGVSGFGRLSVREQRGAELIKQCSGRDAEVICDPTLMLSAGEWRSVSDNRLTPDRPYVFTYLLGGVGTEAADVIKQVTDDGKIPIVPLSDREKPEEPPAGPAEFISLVDNAQHVVTDSFHAAIFSCIFQTPLTIVHRENETNMFSRLESLADMLDIQSKIYGSLTYDLSLAGNYRGVPESIESEREKFMAYLKSCLNI